MADLVLVRGRRVVPLAALVMCALWVPPAHAAGAAPVQGQSSLWPANPDWQRYVEAPASTHVLPVRVLSVSGDVRNADGLVNGSGGTTLNFPAGGTPPMVTLDYGKDVGGLPRFVVSAVGSATSLHSAYSEELANLTYVGDSATNHAYSNNRYDDFAVSQPATFQDATAQGGQRYQLLTLSQLGNITLQSVSTEYIAFLGRPDTFRGHFVSSSDLLNRIWYAGAYTMNLNQDLVGTPPNLPQDVPVVWDGAKRDRQVWAGDLGQEALTLYYMLGNAGWPYVKGSLTDFADHPCAASTTSFGGYSCAAGNDPAQPGPMPGSCSGPTTSGCGFWAASYSMAFPISMYQYYLYSGDLAFVSQEWPLVQREISWQNSLVDSSGLVATTTDGLDWNLDPHVGDYTYYNALHYEALRDAAVLAGAVGRTALGTTYLHQADAVKAAINANLWNPSLGAYDAATSPAERGFYVQDANAEAVLSGIAPPDRARSVTTHLAANLISPYGMPNVTSTGAPDYTAGANGVLISPYVGSFTVQADFAARTDELAYALIQREWGHMINSDPGGVDWEKIHTDGTLASGDSAAHGWSTGATSALSQYALGASPLTPGYGTYLVEPHPGGGLSWVEGQVPTSNGPLGVNWGYDALNSRFQLQTDAPPGSRGTVSVPLLGAPRVITEDGKVVWDGSRPVGALSTGIDGQYVRFTGVTGTHLWSWAPPAAAAAPSRGGPQSGTPNASGQSVAPLGSGGPALAILCVAAVSGRRRRASNAGRGERLWPS